MEDAVVVLVTTPTAEKAAEIARALVVEKLVACGNVLPAVRSIYAWQGEVHDEPEALLVLKAPRQRLEELSDRILALHPYEVPEVVALPIVGGSERYLDWIIQSMY
ncbi:MAG TPA: divalent-cation tolerance protein CutA [Anaeromyxobacteraceae bacterium]|nr:divalent-cation tolerance protein CutA [Anaeromyxobacteraceae bacterium]